MNIAIIPARAGSKRLKNKNLKTLSGKPLIYYAINTAIKSKLFDDVVISTDSPKILNKAKKFGANNNGLRSKKLSDNRTLLLDVVKYEIQKHEKSKSIKNVCCILPTNIYNNKKLLTLGLKRLSSNKKGYIFCATKTPTSVFRGFTKKKNQETKMIFPSMFNKGSHLLQDTYFDFGNFYWARKNTWLNKKIIFSKNSRFIEIKNKYYSDINTLEDFKIAKNILNKR